MDTPSILKQIFHILDFDDTEAAQHEQIFNEYVLRLSLYSLMETLNDQDKEELKMALDNQQPIPLKFATPLQEMGKKASELVFKDFMKEILANASDTQKQQIDAVFAGLSSL